LTAFFESTALSEIDAKFLETGCKKGAVKQSPYFIWHRSFDAGLGISALFPNLI
jgi:hypothetical protein